MTSDLAETALNKDQTCLQVRVCCAGRNDSRMHVRTEVRGKRKVFFFKNYKVSNPLKKFIARPPREQGATRHGHQSSMSDNHRSTKQNLSKGSLSNSVCCIQSVWSVAWNVCREPAGILDRGPRATLIKLQQKTVSDLHVKLSSSSCS